MTEEGKQYRFQLTKKEILEFCIRAVWEQQRLQPLKWLLIAAVCVLDILLSPRIGGMAALMILLLYGAGIWWNFSLMKKSMDPKTWVMWIENGMLKTQLGVYSEIPCRSIELVRETQNLLMLGHFQAKRRLAWYPMPLRVFESQQEKISFLILLREGGGVHKAEVFPTEKAENVLFCFRFFMDEEKWPGLLAGATEALRSGCLGKTGKQGIFLIVYGGMLTVLAGSFFFLGGDRMILMLLFVLVVFLLALLKVRKEDPEKKIRRQIRSGILQNDVYGEWKTVISEDGVMQTGGHTGKSMLPWEELSWLVETEDAFYLFQEDRKHFIMIPMECLESREQAAALKQLCIQKQLNIVAAKKRKHMPGWVFPVLLAAAVIGYLGVTVWLAVRDGRQRAEEWQQGSGMVTENRTEEFDPADYPGYVPLDEQAEVLRSLGFTVTQETVESVRSDMEEYNIRAYVEGDPYTWLLSGLGMPRYNEEQEIIGYSDEVFWFDFEGWDISTDYIEVLEGMKALAAGSLLDGVKNIRENVDNVDWEAGSGEVTVSLEWQGREHSWQMDVQYDWIDGRVLGIFNSLLAQEKAGERFYAAGDGGQGALVFFCSEAWAEKFEKATGLALDFCTAEEKTRRKAIVMTR